MTTENNLHDEFIVSVASFKILHQINFLLLQVEHSSSFFFYLKQTENHLMWFNLTHIFETHTCADGLDQLLQNFQKSLF